MLRIINFLFICLSLVAEVSLAGSPSARESYIVHCKSPNPPKDAETYGIYVDALGEKKYELTILEQIEPCFGGGAGVCGEAPSFDLYFKKATGPSYTSFSNLDRLELKEGYLEFSSWNGNQSKAHFFFRYAEYEVECTGRDSRGRE